MTKTQFRSCKYYGPRFCLPQLNFFQTIYLFKNSTFPKHETVLKVLFQLFTFVDWLDDYYYG